MLQGGQVMLVLQADDRAFLTQLTNAGQKGGRAAGEAMVREINSALGKIKIPDSVLKALTDAGKLLNQPITQSNNRTTTTTNNTGGSGNSGGGGSNSGGNSGGGKSGGGGNSGGGGAGAAAGGGGRSSSNKDEIRRSESNFNRIESDALKTKLSTATNVNQQIDLKLEIDKVAIKEQYAQAIHNIEKELQSLEARGAAAREAGTPVQHINRMSYEANQRLGLTKVNRDAAFEAMGINKGEAGVTPRTSSKRITDPRDDLRKASSNFNKIEKEALQTKLAATTDVTKQIGLKVEIDKITIKEKYSQAIHEVEKELRELASKTKIAEATGAPTAHLGQMTYAATKQLNMLNKNRDAAMQVASTPSSPNKKNIDPRDELRKIDSNFNKIEKAALQTKLGETTDVAKQIGLKVEIDKIAVKEKYAAAIHEVEKQLRELASKTQIAEATGAPTAHLGRMTYAANKQLRMLNTNRDTALQAASVPRSPDKKKADPRDELRKIDSNFNKLEKEALQTKLAGTTDVTKQLGLKVEIDKIDVKEKYAAAVHKIEKELRELESKTAIAQTTGAPTAHLGRMTYAATKQLDMATKNRDAALAEIDNRVPKASTKKVTDPADIARKAESSTNKTERDALKNRLIATTDHQERINLKIDIDRNDIKEKYQQAIYQIQKEIKSLEAQKSGVVATGGSTAQLDLGIKNANDRLAATRVNYAKAERSNRIQESGGVNPNVKIASPTDENRRAASLANKQNIERLQGVLSVTTEVKDRLNLTLEIDKAKIKEKYDQAKHEIDKELKALNARKITSGAAGESTVQIDGLIRGNRQRRQTLDTNRDRALVDAELRKVNATAPAPKGSQADEFRRANSVAANLAIDALKTKLAGTTDVTQQLNLKIEINKAQIKEKYAQAIYQLEKEIQNLEKRKDVTQSTGGVNAAANINALIGKSEQNLIALKANRDAALAAAAVVPPPAPPKAPPVKLGPVEKDELRRSQSNLNRTDINSLQNKLSATTDPRKRIGVKLEIDKAEIKERYAEAIHKIENELKALNARKAAATAGGLPVSLHLKTLISNAEKNLASTTANRTDAFRGAEVAAQNAARKINNTFFGIKIPDVGGQFAKGLRYAISPSFASSIGQGIGTGIMTGIMAGIQAGIGGVVGLIKDSIEVGGDFEKSRVTFTSILGSPEEAEKMLRMVQKLAETTPFEIKGIRESSQKLSAVGIKDVDQNRDKLKMLGDIAAGTGSPIEDITEQYTKAKAYGRVYTREIKQLSNRGVPIVEMLAKNMGVAQLEVKNIIESGNVTFDQYELIVKQLTSNGGMFENLMEKQSKTVLGKISNLNDQFTNIKIKVFDALNPASSSIIDILSASVKGVAENDAQFATLNERAKEFADNMAANPENAEAIQKAITDLANEGFNILIDQAEQLVTYLKENPTAVADTITAAKELAGVLADIVGLVGLVVKGWMEISTLIQGAENKGAAAMLNATEKAEVDRRMKKATPMPGFMYALHGQSDTYDKVYQNTIAEVRAESALKRQKRNIITANGPKDNVLMVDGKQVPNMVDGKQMPVSVNGKPIMGPAYPSSSEEVAKLDKQAKLDAKNKDKPQRPESNENEKLIKNQNAQIRKAQSGLKIAKQKARIESLDPDSTERISLERELAVSEVREKHSEKIAKLRVELGDFEKKKALKIKEGRKGGIDYTVAIDKTRKLIKIEQEVLNTELISSRDKFDNQQIESKRAKAAFKKSGVSEVQRAKETNETARLTSLSDAQTPNSQKQQQINYKITVAAINSKYRDTNFTQQERLTELQNKQEDKIRRKETGGVDYGAAIARQREIIRLTQSSKNYELDGAESKRKYEIKTDARAKLKEREDARNRSLESLEASTSNLDQGRYRIKIATTSNSQEAANQTYKAAVRKAKDDALPGQNNIIDRINEAERAKLVQKESGDTGGVNYDEIIVNLKKELAQSDIILADQLKLMAIEKKKEDVMRARDTADRRTAANRANRDKNLDNQAADKISALENSKAGITDPLTLLNIDKQIADLQLEITRTNDRNSLYDELADLQLKRTRANQNVSLGIVDPNLEGATIDKDIASVQGRIKGVDNRYIAKKTAIETQFTRDVGENTRQNLLNDGRQIDDTKIKALEDSLVNIKDEKIKIEVQFEIDQTRLTRNYIEAQAQIQQEIDQLQQQKDTMLKNGLTVPVYLKERIATKEKTKLDVRQTYEDTIKGNATRFVDNKVLADVRTSNNNLARERGIFTPTIDANEAYSQQRMDNKDFAGAAKYGRMAALEKERLRYQADKTQTKEFAAQQSIAGTPIDPLQLQQMNEAIDYMNRLNLDNITAQFDDMARSINESTVALQEMGKTQTQEFIQGLLSGTKSFGDLWNDLVNNILDGMAQMISKQFTDQLFGNTPGKQGGGILGGLFGALGGLFGGGGGGGDSGGKGGTNAGLNIGLGAIIPGFKDGGLVPDRYGSKDYRSGNNPIADALRKEGPPTTATLVAATIGERILTLQETAAYHNLFPNGIMNYSDGGIVGSMGGNSINAGSATGGKSINLGGEFGVNVDVSNNSKPNDQLAELVPKLMSAMRNTIQEETRPNGIIHRFSRG